MCVIYILYLEKIYYLAYCIWQMCYSAYHIWYSLFIPAPHVNEVRDEIWSIALHIAVKRSALLLFALTTSGLGLRSSLGRILMQAHANALHF
jgi:hypothetical protein